MTVERVPPKRPLTPMQLLVVSLLAVDGLNAWAIAEHLQLARSTVHWHIREASKKLPGDLPAQMRVVAWYRGATHDVLTGTSARNARS